MSTAPNAGSNTVTVFTTHPSTLPKPTAVTLPTLTGTQVLLETLASGLCATDLLFLRSKRPQGLGHEGIGRVVQTGPDVRRLKRGDRVGWGYMHWACLSCSACTSGADAYCASREMYGTHDLAQGSFSTGAVFREEFLFDIPDAIATVDAAPLMCAGATVFSGLERAGVRGGEAVGVIGLGGLGHLAVQFASSLGCYVTVFSGTEGKSEEARGFGAREFVVVRRGEKVRVKRRIDVLLVTSGGEGPDWGAYVGALAMGAKVVLLSLGKELRMPYMPLVNKGITVQGSMVASRGEMGRMLRFVELHGIKPAVEVFDMDERGLAEAIERLKQGKLRYRAVLVPGNVTEPRTGERGRL